MRAFHKPLMGLALCLGSACGGSSADQAEEAKPEARWHVADGFVRDPEGRATVLRGVNIANAHKRPPYFGFHTEADFARVRREWGMNAIRYLVVWAAIEPERDRYDEAYLDAVSERIEWAERSGLQVIIDMHQDVYGEGFGGDGAPRWTCDEALYAAHVPTSPWFLNYASEEVVTCFDRFWQSEDLVDHYVEAWARVAERVGHSPAVVGFDPMNEPYWGSADTTSFEREILQPFYERIANRVRESAPDWVMFAEPFAGRNLGFATSLEEFSVRDVVYAPHLYDGTAEAGNGFSASGRSSILLKGEALHADAERLGCALWMGEYGGNASNDGITPYMDAVYDAAAGYAAGTMYWSYDSDGSYGLLDAEGNDKPELLDVVVRPYPLRVAGQPLEVRYDESSGAFTLRWRPDPSLVAPTLVSIPARAYPDGAVVECAGCEHEQVGGELRITRPPEGDEVSVTVRP